MKRVFCAICLTILAVACGTTPTSPGGGGGATITVSSVSPATLSTTGGATVTIAGTGFGTDATVSLDGVAVTGATVTSTSIAFSAPTHASGAGTFTVTSGGKTATGAVTFVAPSGANLAPAISNLRTIGSRNNQPSLFVDLNEEVQLIGTVSNVETNTTLTYAWTVGAGTVSGTGPSVLWKLPSLLTTTPTPVAATLTVTETYTESGVQHRNVATASVLADVHDSSTEILDKGFRFLDLFSQSSIPPAQVMSDFSTSCAGYAQELQDTIDIRDNYVHMSYSITRLPPVEFKFGQSCVWPDGRTNIADACSVYRAHWVVRALRDVADDGVHAGDIATTDGRDFIGNVLQNGQWKLCSSTFIGDPATTTVVGLDGEVRTIPTAPGMVPGRIKRQ